MKRLPAGFTLIELLVALLITAIIGVMSYRGLSSMLQARERLHANAQAWQAVHRFVSAFEADWRNAMARTGRDANGVVQAAYIGLPVSERPFGVQLAMQRAGTGAATELTHLTRIGYRLTDGDIQRVIWPAPDLSPRGKPIDQVVLRDVASWSLRYRSIGSPWSTQWPPPGSGAARVDVLPDGLELTLIMRDAIYGGPITWVFAR